MTIRSGCFSTMSAENEPAISTETTWSRPEPTTGTRSPTLKGPFGWMSHALTSPLDGAGVAVGDGLRAPVRRGLAGAGVGFVWDEAGAVARRSAVRIAVMER